jgi:hypothetical protein
MCSLQEAFQDWNTEESVKQVVSRSQKKKRRAVLPPEPAVIEPDRPGHRQLPAAELLGGAPTENTESTSISSMLNAMESNDYFPHPTVENNDSNVYKLEPDWAKAFDNDSAPSWIKERMPPRYSEAPLIPSPWMDGAPTLWQKVPSAMAHTPGLDAAQNAASSQLDSLQKKLDQMFTKLDALETTRAESNHVEIILFVLGGVFLLLLLDLLVKQGTHVAAYMASAGATAAVGMNTYTV